MLERVPQPIWTLDAHSGLTYLNAAARDYLGVDQHDGELLEQVRRAPMALVHPDDRCRVRTWWDQQSSEPGTLELRVRHRGGGYRWVRASLADHDGTGSWTGSFTDVHEWVLQQRELATMTKVRDDMLDVSVDCIKIIDTDGKLMHMNRSGCLALGVPLDEKEFGMRWLDLLPPEIRSRGQRALAVARTGKNARFAGMSVVGDNKPQHWDNILTPVIDESGTTTAILCVSRDITLQREAEQRLRIASEIDGLTELLNRRSFKVRLKRALTRAGQSGKKAGLLLIDLDHFKTINDTLGHPAGDHLLRVLSKRLGSALPKNTTVARLGGDEFAILVEGVEDDQDVAAIAELVAQQLDAPISYAGRLINGGMSIGCAVYPRDAWDLSALMSCADTALNDLKADGRGGVRMFSRRMLESAEQAAAQLNRSRQIVRDGLIEPHYQPKVRLADGRLVGFEALLRWNDPERGLQMPGTVAEAFKDYELATGMGAAMHNRVLADMAAWRERGLSLVPVSINADPVEFLRGDFADRLLEKLETYRIPPQLIEIEVTEHVLLERGAEFVANALRTLKDAGVGIALDDFGTGHSSFAHLRDYPVDSLKIDMSFVKRMVDEPSILAIVKAILKLGPTLWVDVIAEGVETEEQRRILLDSGCRIGQGFLFDPAISAHAAARWLGRAPSAQELADLPLQVALG